jgi:hypothetical protein
MVAAFGPYDAIYGVSSSILRYGGTLVFTNMFVLEHTGLIAAVLPGSRRLSAVS